MRNLTMCDIRLNPSTVTSTFETTMICDIMPNAGDLPRPPGTLFIRSLYRAAGDAFPPTYRCLVNSILVSDSGFFSMRPLVLALGASMSQPQFRLLAGVLPNDELVLNVLQAGRYRTLLMVTVHLTFGLNQEHFEKELVAALAGEIGDATEVNSVLVAFWTRDDSVVFGKTEYLIAALGDFMRPQLKDDTLDQIRAAGGEVAQSVDFLHIGTVFGDETSRGAE